MRTWFGLTGLREVVERLRPRLRTFRDEHGCELFDLPEAPRPRPDSPTPPRFLPEYDNLLLAHADRARMITEENRCRFPATENGRGPGTVLVDGFVRAIWRLIRDRGMATLMIQPFSRLSGEDMTALTAEGARLLAFVAVGAKAHDIVNTDPA